MIFGFSPNGIFGKSKNDIFWRSPKSEGVILSTADKPPTPQPPPFGGPPSPLSQNANKDESTLITNPSASQHKKQDPKKVLYEKFLKITKKIS